MSGTDEIAGYIHVIGSKTPTKTSAPQFDIVMQDGANSTTQIIGFGKECYDNILPFAKSRSPVKMDVRDANQIGYEFNNQVTPKKSGTSTNSTDISAQELLTMEAGV